jgi:hypothetical protein
VTAPTSDPTCHDRVAWLIELWEADGGGEFEHVEGCEGQVECHACIIADLKATLAEPDRPIGGRRFS